MAKRFSELGIKVEMKSFDGDKIKMKKLLNKEIKVLDYKIETSKFPDGSSNGKCLHMHIEMGGERFVVFTGSRGLQEAIRQVRPEDFPVVTTIVEENNSMYEFT